MQTIIKKCRNIGIVLFLISTFMPVFGQFDCDILTPGISAMPSSIMPGQTTDLVFTVYNDAQGGDCCYDVESVLVYVFLPENGGLTFQSIVSPSGGTGPYFDWVFDSGSNTVIGTNHTEICDDQGELNVTVRVVGSTLPFYPQNRTVGITILNNPDGPPFTSNNEGNDNGFTTVTINAPLPVELVSLDASSSHCQEIELFWQTASEINNKLFEIQRSRDGSIFSVVGDIKATNQNTGGSYRFTDNNAEEATTYYYRLRQMDLDGKETYYGPVSCKTSSCRDGIGMSIYPNPAMDKVYINIQNGEEYQFRNIRILNTQGKVVKEIISPVLTSQIEIEVAGLTSGLYTLEFETDANTHVEKFIKL